MPPKRNGRKNHMKKLNENRAAAAAAQPGPSHEPDSEYEPEPEQDDGADGGGGGSVEEEEMDILDEEREGGCSDFIYLRCLVVLSSSTACGHVFILQPGYLVCSQKEGLALDR